MNIQSTIQTKLGAFEPDHLEVINESVMHNVPDGSESHFKVVIVTAAFEGKGLVARHRLVNECLKAELSGKIHALALHAMTPDEWFDRAGQSTDSPPCAGGERTN